MKRMIRVIAVLLVAVVSLSFAGVYATNEEGGTVNNSGYGFSKDNGQYIVSITNSIGLHHNSDGLGEGVVSLMFIVDALCGIGGMPDIDKSVRMKMKQALKNKLNIR